MNAIPSNATHGVKFHFRPLSQQINADVAREPFKEVFQ